MIKNLTVRNITQSQGKASVQFVELDKDKKPTTLVILQFEDGKQAKQFEDGVEYTVSIKPKK